jgi:DNA repair protein RecN (Recombination protein N)
VRRDRVDFFLRVLEGLHEERGRTITTIEELDAKARTREIGRMLSGERVTPEALRHAEQLIKHAAK